MADQTRVDPVTFELVKNGLMILCDEMGLTMARTAYSPVVREMLDYATALLTPEGEVMALARANARHLGPMMGALQAIQREFADDMRPGDVFIHNDPYDGASHLPDLFIMKPVFVDGTIHAFVGAEAHMCDFGGRVPGSNACDSTEIYQEGLRIPASRLLFQGEPNRTLWGIVEKNVRQSSRVLGDIRAMLAAIGTGERGFLKLVGRYGAERLRAYVDEIIDYTERVVRTEIAGWPDGDYVFEDAIDDDGGDSAPIPLRVKITVQGDELEMDFSGTGRQARTAINTCLWAARTNCYLGVRAAMPPQLPHNSGLTRPIRIRIPEGTMLNPRPPAAVAARALVTARMTNVVLGALAQIVPQRMMAGDEGGNALITLAGTGPAARRWIFTDIHLGAWGGRHDRDGVDGLCNVVVSVANTPCEIVELEYPIRMQRYGFVPDACGAGQFRGGLAVVREYQMLTDETMVQVRSDRQKIRPYGLYGGGPGTPSANVVNPGPHQRELPSKFMVWLNAGDVYRCRLAGGGGWGDRLRRDPALVQRDVRDEKISVAYAAREHGVAFDPATGAVDESTTVRLRAGRGTTCQGEQT